MEYVDGKPLAGPLPLDQAIAYGIQICEALSAAHKKGIVHRDLKPANILLTKQGVKLSTSASRSSRRPPGPAAARPAAAVGRAGHDGRADGRAHVVGTPQYMAPEQIEGGDVDARTDIFAFGCVLYELLTGKHAFEGKSASSIMASVLATSRARSARSSPSRRPPSTASSRAASPRIPTTAGRRTRRRRGAAVGRAGRIAGRPARGGHRAERKTREGLSWGVSAIAVLAAVGFGIAWARRAPEPLEITRFASRCRTAHRTRRRPRSRPTDGRSSSSRATPTASGRSGCGRSTRSRRERSATPTRTPARSGRPTVIGRLHGRGKAAASGRDGRTGADNL